jgi:hypothetical protein
MRRPALITSLILLVGVFASIEAIKAHESNTAFVASQEKLLPVSASALETLVGASNDPRPSHRGRARSAHCSTRTKGALGNPWTCVVRYPRLPLVRYTVIVRADRSISGRGEPVGAPLRGALILKGCCVAEG